MCYPARLEQPDPEDRITASFASITSCAFRRASPSASSIAATLPGSRYGMRLQCLFHNPGNCRKTHLALQKCGHRNFVGSVQNTGSRTAPVLKIHKPVRAAETCRNRARGTPIGATAPNRFAAPARAIARATSAHTGSAFACPSPIPGLSRCRRCIPPWHARWIADAPPPQHLPAGNRTASRLR